MTLLLAMLGCIDPSPIPLVEDCQDGVDNNGNGLTDCWDSACDCVEQDCTDGVDNDADERVDCADYDCKETCTEDCSDGIDNDQDGLLDCADVDDCRYAQACEEDCQDGVDNDLDGTLDCLDSDCEESMDCLEDCLDGVDNDADTLVDCADPECSSQCPEDCFDGQDNDADGLVDCADYECKGLPKCEEVCGDGLDNDQNGLTDCEDWVCTRFCQETSCSDGVDEDSDGLLDCEDEDCWGREDCPRVAQLFIRDGHYQGSWVGVDYLSTGQQDRSSAHGVLRGAVGTMVLYSGSELVDCSWKADNFAVHHQLQGQAQSMQLSFADEFVASTCADTLGLFSGSVHVSSGELPSDWAWRMDGSMPLYQGAAFLHHYESSGGTRYTSTMSSSQAITTTKTADQAIDHTSAPLTRALP